MFRIKIGLSISTIYFDNTNHNHPKKYAHCHCGLVQVALFISFCVTSLAGRQSCHGPLTRYLKLWAAHAPRMSGTFSPPPSSKETASYRPPGMHHGTCVPHVPWCMSGSLTRGDGENVPGITSACATRNFTYLVRGPLCQCPWSNHEEDG